MKNKIELKKFVIYSFFIIITINLFTELNYMEKTCDSCKYYREHFVKKDTRLYPVGGHCINSNLTAHKRTAYNPNKDCNYWEKAANQKEERRQAIKVVLIKMQKTLEQIAIILKDDDI